MKIENLKTFLQIAQAESINKAAEQLYTSHQNLNALIKKLEDELETTLFIRSNKGIMLNEDGEKLFEAASQIVTIYDNLITQIKNDSDIIPFYMPTSLAQPCNDLQGFSYNNVYVSVYMKDINNLLDILKSKKRAFVFLPITEDNIDKYATFKNRTTINTDLYCVSICHKNNPILSPNSTLKPRTICTLSRDFSLPNTLNIDDITICQKLMKEENFVYTTTESLYHLHFPKDDYVCYDKKTLEHPVHYILFSNLPTASIYKELRKEIINCLSTKFKM